MTQTIIKLNKNDEIFTVTRNIHVEDFGGKRPC